MFTLSENKDNHFRTFIWFRPVILWTLLLLASTAIGQSYPVRITIAVTPPYSTRISDYTSQPNKIMAIESREGISPLRSHGTVLESLPSHGSSCLITKVQTLYGFTNFQCGKSKGDSFYFLCNLVIGCDLIS